MLLKRQRYKVYLSMSIMSMNTHGIREGGPGNLEHLLTNLLISDSDNCMLAHTVCFQKIVYLINV